MAAAPRLIIQTIKDVTLVSFEEVSLLDSAQIEKLGGELYRLVEELNRKRMVLDMTKVKFLSSAALGVLINLRKKSAAIKGDFVICGLRKELMKVFEITNLTKLFTFSPGEKEALATYGITPHG